MKMLKVITLLFLFSSASAQVFVTGKLIDPVSEKALSRATVSIYDARDTSLLACRLSKSGGDFTLPGIPLNIPCTMIVYDSGYAVYRKAFTLTGNDTFYIGNILLAHEIQPLEEVLAYAERPPVIVHKNKIEFNGSMFEYSPGSKQEEESLKRVPDVIVSFDGSILIPRSGSIKVYGKKIKRIFVADMSLVNSLQ